MKCEEDVPCLQRLRSDDEDTHLLLEFIFLFVSMHIHHSPFTYKNSVKIAFRVNIQYNIQPTNLFVLGGAKLQRKITKRPLNLINHFFLSLAHYPRIDGIVCYHFVVHGRSLSRDSTHRHTQMVNIRPFYCVKTYLF